jgi:hypothetical protein
MVFNSFEFCLYPVCRGQAPLAESVAACGQLFFLWELGLAISFSDLDFNDC